MAKTKNRRSVRHRFASLCGMFLIAGWFLLNMDIASAATITSASVSVADPRPSATAVAYSFTGSNVTLSNIRCIRMVFADAPQGGVVPAAMNTTLPAVALDTVNTNYVPTPGTWSLNKTTNGTLLITNATGQSPASASGRQVAINGITNGSTPDTKYFLRVSTYNNVDCTTTPVDSTTVGFIYTNGSTLSLTVDATLSFTVNAVAGGQACNGATTTAASTSTTIPFGTVSPASNSVVCQDLTAATNASNGFSVFLRYTGKPTNSLGDQIADHGTGNANPTVFSAAGTEAYGYTTEDLTLQAAANNRFNGNRWAAATTTNAEVVYNAAGVASLNTRVGHQVGVSSVTRPGTYTTTVIYTCTPVY